MKTKLFLFLSALVGGLLFALPSTYALELSGGNIQSYCTDITATFCNLNSKGITSIAPGTFSGYNNLKKLELKSNQLTGIENGAFSGLSNLTKLYLENNQISSIHSGMWAGLSNLERLYLNNNQISSIHSGTFAALSNLTTLNLDDNQISSIHSGMWVGLSSLIILDLNYNQISSIHSGAFAGLSSLDSLSLVSNQTSNIYSGAFTGLSSLTLLELSYNQISSIHSGMWAGLSSVIEIYLGVNQISSIHSGAFAGLSSSFKELSLHTNQISSIEDGALSHLANITRLDITNNCIDADTLPDAEKNFITDKQSIRANNQYVCVRVGYNPTTLTSGDVSSFLYFVGPTAKRTTLSGENTMSDYDHTYTSNGTHLYDFSSIVDSANNLWLTVNGGSKTITGEVTWINKAPVVTLNGNETVLIEKGGVYTESGATRTDHEDGSGTITGATNGITVNTSVTGTYNLEYRKVDNAGNKSNVVTRTVIVMGAEPVVTLNGDANITIKKGGTYTELGATWIDAKDVTGTISTPNTGAVDTDTIGTYILEYRYEDSDHNQSNIVTRTVTVKKASSGGGGSSSSESNNSSGSQQTGTEQTNLQNLDELIDNYKEENKNNPEKLEQLEKALASAENSNVDQELKDAYIYAFLKGITTQATIEEAELDRGVTRAEMAKMMVMFATKVLGKEKVKTDNVQYPDVDSSLGDLADYIQLAYQLQIMGIDANGNPIKNFNPHGEVTRAEFATVLSRILYGSEYNQEGADFYSKHLEALKEASILKNTTPTMKELRGWVMLMLMRTSVNK